MGRRTVGDLNGSGRCWLYCAVFPEEYTYQNKGLLIWRRVAWQDSTHSYVPVPASWTLELPRTLQDFGGGLPCLLEGVFVFLPLRPWCSPFHGFPEPIDGGFSEPVGCCWCACADSFTRLTLACVGVLRAPRHYTLHVM
ncbi:hypothetical protein NDU88_002569 [Pleurodeles waltl]|uniref:Uncharacterized protein n=1 Tax=Pleurodeles waltl TaxID=8319 RepID=A0AAV7MP73_PLEWA|nr:hypothetical protein NDU88_002569 [Pleurodeles waltl]